MALTILTTLPSTSSTLILSCLKSIVTIMCSPSIMMGRTFVILCPETLTS